MAETIGPAGDISMVRTLKDPANVVTMAGLCFAVTGVYLAIPGLIHIGAALLGAALLCDMLDGQVARRSSRRPEYLSRIGGELDSLADVIHGGVLPGIILNTVTGYAAWSIVIALILCICVVARLSYFNVFGPRPGGGYNGVPVIFNSFSVCLIIAFAPASLFVPLLVPALLVLSALNMASIPVPKLTGRSLSIFLVLVVVSVLVNALRAAGV